MSPQQEAELFDRLFALEAYTTVLGTYVCLSSSKPDAFKSVMDSGLENMINNRPDMPEKNKTRIREQFEKISSSIHMTALAINED